MDQYTYLAFLDLGQNAKAEADFSPGQNTTIGVVWTGFWSSHRENRPAGARFSRTEGGPVYLQTQTGKTYNVFSQNQVGNLKHAFGEKAKQGQLTADFDIGHFSRDYTLANDWKRETGLKSASVRTNNDLHLSQGGGGAGCCCPIRPCRNGKQHLDIPLAGCPGCGCAKIGLVGTETQI